MSPAGFVLAVILSVPGAGHQGLFPGDDNYIAFDTAGDCRRAAMIAVGMWAGEAEAKCYERGADGKLGRVVSETSRSG